MKDLQPIHPLGEGQMCFPTHLGTVHLESSDEAMSPFLGLVTWAAFQGKASVFETLAKDCSVGIRQPPPIADPNAHAFGYRRFGNP